MILASQSPRRRQLLEELGYTLEVLPADIDEARRGGESPDELVRRLAEQKAAATLELARAKEVRDADGLLVAADTIVWDDEGDVLGKPVNEADAERMLRALSGKTHRVSTGCCVIRLGEGLAELGRSSFVETTEVEFWPLTDAQVAAYVASGEPMDKAGSYGIQGYGAIFVDHLEGDYFSVMGLPLCALARMLAECGVSILREKEAPEG